MITILIITTIISISLSIVTFYVIYRMNIYVSSFEEDYDNLVLKVETVEREFKLAVKEEYLEKEYDENNNITKTKVKVPRVKRNT